MRFAWVGLLVAIGCGTEKVVYVEGPQGDAAPVDASEASAGDDDAATEGGPDALVDAPSPEAAPVPECTTTADVDLVDQALACGEKYCSTTGDASGTLPDIDAGDEAGTECLVTNCAGQLINVQGSSDHCYQCIMFELQSGVTFATTRATCVGGSGI